MKMKKTKITKTLAITESDKDGDLAIIIYDMSGNVILTYWLSNAKQQKIFTILKESLSKNRLEIASKSLSDQLNQSVQ